MNNETAAEIIQPTHRVTYKGHVRDCHADTFTKVCAELVAQYGAGEIPQVEKLKVSPTLPSPAPRTPAGQVDLAGKLRAEGDAHTAEDAGFAPKPPIYTAGTRVVSAGVNNARAMQVDHDSKPSARAVAGQLVDWVKAEKRCDLEPVLVSDLRMTKAGKLVLPTEAGVGSDTRYPLSYEAFGSLMGRFPCKSGLAYLSSCPQQLRSINFNHWSVEQTRREDEGIVDKAPLTVLRTREGAAGREVFASVSPSYTAFDADKIGEALRFAFPEDAKGVLDYDGRRVRIEGLWRTDVAPEEFVAGEFFKAGVIVRSSDDGSGSIQVQSVIWRNLCLNLIILDRAVGVDIRIRHAGSVRELATKFQQAFREALTSVEGFRKAWGYAVGERDDELVKRVQGTTSEDLSKLPASAVLPGIFNGILERELVPVRGRKQEVVPKLLELHAQDEAAEAYGVSRASVVNAFTRYAHQIETDPFRADDIRSGAGKLLSARAGRRPAPLPYKAFAGAL